MVVQWSYCSIILIDSLQACKVLNSGLIVLLDVLCGSSTNPLISPGPEEATAALMIRASVLGDIVTEEYTGFKWELKPALCQTQANADRMWAFEGLS